MADSGPLNFQQRCAALLHSSDAATGSGGASHAELYQRWLAQQQQLSMFAPVAVVPHMAPPAFVPHMAPPAVNTTGYVPIIPWGWQPDSSMYNVCNACGLSTYGRKRNAGHMLLCFQIIA